jgi:hypothetical protein
MQIQVTKDIFGITIWPIDEKLIYAPEKDGFKAGWVREKWTIFPSKYQLFTPKQVKKYFPPDFASELKDGDLKVCEVIIIPT